MIIIKLRTTLTTSHKHDKSFLQEENLIIDFKIHQ